MAWRCDGVILLSTSHFQSSCRSLGEALLQIVSLHPCVPWPIVDGDKGTQSKGGGNQEYNNNNYYCTPGSHQDEAE